jgi:hypothetical protein
MVVSRSHEQPIFIHPGLLYLQDKRLIIQTTTITPPRHREDRGQSTKEQVTPASMRPRSPGARGHSLDHRSGLHFARTQAALARTSAPGSVTRQQAMQIESPSRLHWRPRCQFGLEAASSPQTMVLPVRMVRQCCPAPGLERVQSKSTGSTQHSVHQPPCS